MFLKIIVTLNNQKVEETIFYEVRRQTLRKLFSMLFIHTFLIISRQMPLLVVDLVNSATLQDKECCLQGQTISIYVLNTITFK